MTELYKPDMQAVLERTRLGTSLEDLLLPVYEAISNSIHSIEERLFAIISKDGSVKVDITGTDSAAEFCIRITDNGVGLDDKNYRSFLTPYSGHKLKRNGKGVGRFMAFKCFKNVEYESIFEASGKLGKRSFKFDIYHQPDEIYDEEDTAPNLKGVGCSVAFVGLRPSFEHLLQEFSGQNIVERIVSHFVPYFLNNAAPEIQVTINGVQHDAREFYAKTFSAGATGAVVVNGQSLDFAASRVPKSKLYSHHALFVSTSSRVVGAARDVTDKIGTPYFEGKDGTNYILVIQVSGQLIDQRVNEARTQVHLTPEEIGDIVNSVCKQVLVNENEERIKIEARKQRQVLEILRTSPILKLGLKGQSISQYAESKPNGWDEVRFVQDLSLNKHRIEKGWFKGIDEFISSTSIDHKDYDKVFGELDDIRKNSLAQYVLHRQKIVEVADKLRSWDGDGKRKKEDVMHEIIMHRNSDTTELGILDHNLWMIDDRLSFVSYVSSDRSMTGKGRPKGSKVPDIAFFEEGLVLGETTGSNVLIVEFKKPGRDDYSIGKAAHDPVQQVLDTVEHIRSTGHIIDITGKTHDVKKGVKIQAYIIDDVLSSMKKLLKDRDFNKTWDETGYSKYHDTYEVFIEVLSYQKMIHDAKIRNATFFDLLMGDLVPPTDGASAPAQKYDSDPTSTENTETAH